MTDLGKRFYRVVATRAVETGTVKTGAGEPGGHRVTLDGRDLPTPAKSPLLLPTAALAEAIAAEWEAQIERIDPHTMPLMQLASTAIDRIATQRDHVVQEIARYAETDLVCYRADEPPELVDRQAQIWQPLADWLAERYGAALTVTTGIVPLTQPPEALAALRAAVDGFDDFELAALHSVTSAAGSLVIGLAVIEGRLDPEEAWAAAHLDETYQAGKWGEDAEATANRAALKTEIAEAHRFLALLRG